MKQQPTVGSPHVLPCKPIHRDYSNGELRKAPDSPVTVYAVSVHSNFTGSNIRLADEDSEEQAYARLFATDGNHDPLISSIEEGLTYVDRARNGGEALAVFSLWTTSYSKRLRAMLDEYSRKFPILFEWFDGRDRCTRIIVDGKTDFQAAQTITTSDDREGDEYIALGKQLSQGTRLWIHPQTGHRFLILICGEINVVLGSARSKAGCRWDPFIEVDPLKKLNIHCVLNPSHTRFGPQAVRDKHQYLSKRCGVLVSCNNTYEELQWGDKRYNAWASNPCWKAGKRVDDIYDKGDYMTAQWVTLPG